ncbi:type II toxin-antitoxin system HicB family antitoxin [Microseira sp. BLCC-F43]|jgi:predicted RNase H-like HicB family nuclease|uniref:type II toxin-antitoxin system HicB family antitoxin n=1 Tax=Microseira sp. BLCC-F43 TaxID=3153602 RepID=UPI0035B9EB1D
MNATLVTTLGQPLTQLTYSILVEKETEGSYKATVWGLTDCQGTGETKESAIANLRHHLKARLEKAEVVSQEIPLSKLTYTVIVEETEGNYQATVWGLPEIQATGETKETVLKSINQLLTARLEKVEVITDKIDLPSKAEHPWMKFAGMFKDDPDFEAVQADIEAYRRELDAEMEAYYQQLDAEEQAK